MKTNKEMSRAMKYLFGVALLTMCLQNVCVYADIVLIMSVI